MIATDAKKMLDPRTLSLVSNYALLARLVVDGFFFGLHRGPRQASSLEYSRHRPYDAGDPLKRIDWKLFAKTDHLYVKQFEEETNLEAWMLMDASPSMSYRGREEPVSKWQYGTYLAAALCHLLLEQHDAAGLVLFDGGLKRVVPPRISRLQLHRILREFYEQGKDLDSRQKHAGMTRGLHAGMTRGLHAGMTKRNVGLTAANFAKAAALAAARMKRRGLVLYFSDLLGPPEEIEQAWKLLKAGGHEVIVFHLLSGDELDFPFEKFSVFEDSETGERVLLDPAAFRSEYRGALRRYLERLELLAQRLEISYCRSSPADSLEQGLHAFLACRERMGR